MSAIIHNVKIITSESTITVKKALTQIDGVIGVKSNLAKRETTVVFDDTRVKVDVLTKATTEAGFPSSVAPAKP